MSKQEKRRLERLKKELDNQQKKLDNDKKKFIESKKKFREQQTKLEREQKQLKQKVRKFQLSQSSGRIPKSPRSGGGGGGGRGGVQLNKVKGELKDTKDQLEKAKKNVRELRKDVNDKELLIKQLKRQLKNAGKGKKVAGDDKLIKQLRREIANLKKRLKLAIRDLDKQARYYQQQLRRFKQDQQKWINRQRDLSKKKGIVVKYVFIDDIRKIKVYKKGKNRIKIKTQDGGEVIVKDVQIVEASEVEEAADDVIDEVTQEIESEFKKKKKKKKKKKGTGDAQDDEEEDDEEEEPQKLDDVKDDDNEEPFEDHTDEVYAELMEELGHRTKDLHRINEIYLEDDTDETQDSNFKELYESVKTRHSKWTAKLTDELKYDLADELPEVNKNWQDEIYKVKDTVIVVKKRYRKKGKKEAEQEAASKYGGNNDNETESKEADEVKYLSAAKDQMITELNGRISDLTQLNDIYFHPENSATIQSKEQQVTQLINNVELRHEGIINELSELPPSANSIDDILPENNEQWKSMIYSTGKELGQNDAEPLRNALELRTKDLEKVVKVLSGEEADDSLNDLIESIQQRNDKNKKASQYNDDDKSSQQKAFEKDNDEWQKIMNNLKAANENLKNQMADSNAQLQAAQAAAAAAKDNKPKQDFAPVSKAQKIVIEHLLGEMDNRRKDLQQLSDLNNNPNKDNNIDPVQEANKLRVAATKRHAQQNNALQQNTRALSAAAKQSGGSGDNDIQEALKLIEDDNKKWQDQLNKLMDDTKNVDDLRKRNDGYMDELNGRIADVLKMKDLYDKANNKSVSRDDTQRSYDSLIQSVKDRHDGVESNMQKTIDKNKEYDRTAIKEMHENDEDWRDSIFNTASRITGLDAPEPEPEPEPQYQPEPEPEPEPEPKKEEKKTSIQPAVSLKIEEKKDDDGTWWLDKDEKRKQYIDSFNVSGPQNNELMDAAVYCDRVLFNPNSDDSGVATDLYFPIPKLDQHHILSTVYDGTMLCDFINKIEAGYIDKRVINYPDPFDPYPLNDKAVKENVSLLLSSARSLGIELESYDVADWMDPAKNVKMVLDVVNGLSDKLLTAKLEPTSHPELMRLTKDNEDPDEVKNLNGEQWLNRWMNNANKQPLAQNVSTDAWNPNLYSTMKTVSPVFNSTAPCNTYNDNANDAAQAMSKHVDNKLKPSGTTVKGGDIASKNEKLIKYFAAEAYLTKSGLPALNANEQNKYKKYLVKQKKSDEDTLIQWINALLPAHLHITHLLRDLSDGVILLKLLEQGRPGCVNWKKAREKVRHKFDKINNCNMVMALANDRDQFGFKLIGMGGSDIVDGHQKFLSTFLWQLMRFNATKAISDLSFGGKNVTDSDILQWANLTLLQFDERQSKPMKNFKDRSLSTCILYNELLAACRPNDVDTSLINYDVRPLVNNRVQDNNRLERIDNARLAMSYVRKFGSDLFVLPEHLCGMDSKAVLSMFAAIMTIGMMESSLYDENGNFKTKKRPPNKELPSAVMGTQYQ